LPSTSAYTSDRPSTTNTSSLMYLCLSSSLFLLPLLTFVDHSSVSVAVCVCLCRCLCLCLCVCLSVSVTLCLCLCLYLCLSYLCLCLSYLCLSYLCLSSVSVSLLPPCLCSPLTSLLQVRVVGEEGQHLKAHKVILSARCGLFRRLIEAEPQCEEVRVLLSFFLSFLFCSSFLLFLFSLCLCVCLPLYPPSLPSSFSPLLLLLSPPSLPSSSSSSCLTKWRSGATAEVGGRVCCSEVPLQRQSV